MNSSVAAGTERSIILATHPGHDTPSHANPLQPIRLALFLCLVAVLGSGCIFSPKKDPNRRDPPPPRVYPQRNTPKNAVLYLAYAWSDRDSVRIDSVYAADYEGNSLDLTDPIPGNEKFFKSDEVHIVGAMAKNRNIVKTEMDFGLQGGWFESSYVSDPPDWRYVQIPSFRIYVNAGADGEFLAKYPGTKAETWILEFTMRPTYPAWAGGEVVWEIVRWVENRQNS